MEMKKEALKLADELDEGADLEADLNRPENQADLQRASAMIRRLVEELDRQNKINLDLIFEKANGDARLQIMGKDLNKQGEPVGRFYWEGVVEGHVVALPSEGTPHYQKDDFPLYTTPQTKPLSDEEIKQLAKRKANQILMDLLMPDVGEPKKIDWNIGCTNQHLVNFARAIEERHGIK